MISSTDHDELFQAAVEKLSTMLPSPRLKEPKRYWICFSVDFLLPAHQLALMSMDCPRCAWKVPFFRLFYWHKCLVGLKRNSIFHSNVRRGRNGNKCLLLYLFVIYHFKLDLIKLFTNLTIFLSMCHTILKNFIQQS